MNKEKIIDINLQTSVKIHGDFDEEWTRKFVWDLENEVEDKLGMGFSSDWKIRDIEEVEE